MQRYILILNLQYLSKLFFLIYVLSYQLYSKVSIKLVIFCTNSNNLQKND